MPKKCHEFVQTRPEASFDLLCPLIGRINKNMWQGHLAHSWLCMAMRWDPETKQATYHMLLNRAGWNAEERLYESANFDLIGPVEERTK